MTMPLEGLRVLDLTRALAGPYCTLMLGDHGADVIKVEMPGTGDDTRGWGPPYIGDQSAYYLQVNRNKRSVTLNLKHPQGRQIFLDLARTADVVVENFTPGVVSRLGIDYAAVNELNPRIVYCSISGFGQTGPYRDRSAYDQVTQGIGGLMSLTGEPSGPPIKVGIAVTDIGAGMQAAFAIMAALYHRQCSGTGQYIDVAMMDVQVSWLTYQAGTYFATGRVPGKTGSVHTNLAPYQTFLCQDGKYINIAVGSERIWQRFCTALDMDWLAQKAEYADNSQRVLHRDTLIPILQAEFMKKPVKEWEAALLAVGVPCGPVNDVADVLNDPHIKERGMVQEVPHPTLGTIKQTGIPPKYSQTPGCISKHPPLLGEHTEEVLSEMGYSEKDRQQLREQGVV